MKLHIFVATTQGLVAIQNIIAIDDADISSIVSINGTSTTANISSAYHHFVKKGAGIIQQDFGACSYRINIDKRIDQGNSWQLAFYLAHAAQNNQLLGDGQVKPGDQVICATGEINTSSREIHQVEDVALKQDLAIEQIEQWQNMNAKTLFLVPKKNRQDINKQLIIDSKLIENLEQALSYLPLVAIPDNKIVSQQSNKIKPNKQNTNAAQQSEDLTNKVGNSKVDNNKAAKNKAIHTKYLIGLLAVVVLILSISILFFSPSRPSTETLKNDDNKLAAQQTWQVLLLTKPHDEMRDDLQLAYSMVEKTISEQLIAQHFEVTDKTLLMGDFNITEQALIELNKEQINLAIRFDLQVNKIIDGSVDTWRYELFAYLIDVESKKQIETHSEYGEFSNEIKRCNQQCLSQWFAENTRKLAQDMGAIIVEKLKSLPRRYQFELYFKRFLGDELLLIDQQLKELNGFVSANLQQEFGAEKELLHQLSSRKYGFVSYLPLGRLELELHRIFSRLGLEVDKRNSDAKTLIFIRKHMPYHYYYVFTGALIFSLLFLFYLSKVKRQHTRALTQFANGQHAQSWLNYHNNIALLPFFRPAQWQIQKNSYISHIKLSKGFSDKAMLSVDKGDYSKVKLAIEKSLRLNADNADAIALKDKLVNIIKGKNQFSLAESMVVAQPEQAIKLLIEAKNLNVNLSENINKSLVQASLKLVFKAFKNKEYYKAYSLIDQYIQYPASIGIDDNNLQKLSEIRASIDQYIQPIKGGVVGKGALKNCFIYTSATLQLGRNFDHAADSFAIAYKQISRVSKQCKFSRENNKFYLEDQGSTNGSYFNNTQLKVGKKVNINKDSQLILGGGSNTDKLAICQLELKVLSKHSSALMMQLKGSVAQLVDIEPYKMAWTSMETDLLSRWILLGKEISLSINNNRIEFGLDKDQADIVAYLIYQNGFYIRPEKPINESIIDANANAIDDSNLVMINQQVIYDAMPISERAIININGFDFSLQSLASLSKQP